MFDIGFSELVFIALLALIVLGPKRLPEVARTAGRWVAKLRDFVTNVKQDFDQQLNTEDLYELRKLKQELEDTRRQIEQTTSKAFSEVTRETKEPSGAQATASANADDTKLKSPAAPMESSETALETPESKPNKKPRTRRSGKKSPTRSKHGEVRRARSGRRR